VTILSALAGNAPAALEVRPRAAIRSETSPASAPPARVSEPAAALRVVEREPASTAEEQPASHPIVRELVAALAQESAPLFAESTPEPEVARPAAKPAAKPKSAQAKQEQMQFEPVTRGRFEKSEPTIVDGQDLDVPTFLRRNVKVK
jgi:cell division protein FtsZ